mgnify:CR=1 FL=1
MDQDVSRALIETVVRRTLTEMRTDPERSIRKLVDMALAVSNGHFQQRFFGIAQRMLEDENSPYYRLVRDTVSYVDIDRLLRFGMNLGYNSCIEGAMMIRSLKAEKGIGVPWTQIVTFLKSFDEEQQAHISRLVGKGESMGIYTWMLFSEDHPLDALPLVSDHPDSAFFLFCNSSGLSRECRERLSELDNVMCVLRFDDDAEEGSEKLREKGILYSVYFPYGDSDFDQILSGGWFEEAEVLRPVFTCLLADRGCSETTINKAAAFAQTALDGQRYRVLPVEFSSVIREVGQIISGDPEAQP